MNKSRISVYRIGRGSGVDIQIDDDSVSRVHAELITTQSGSYYLTDCASSGGSYVARNGEWRRIRQEFISPTDAILLGHYQDDRTRTYRYGRAKGAPFRKRQIHAAGQLAHRSGAAQRRYG